MALLRLELRANRPLVRAAVALAAFLLIAVSGSQLRATPGAGTPEYLLKAVFLFNFARFVEWPSDAFPARDSPIVIGILGHDPFGASLDGIVADESVQGRRLVVRRYRTVEEIVDCHILFIGGSETESLERVFAHIDGKSTLTVGEDDAFARVSGIIRFVTVKSKLRLRINLEAARSAGLTISSKLLRQADIVSGKPST